VHRYSGSARAEIQVSEVSGEVRLEVIDHGKGNKAGEVRAARDGAALGVGIPGMRERLHQLGGRLDVEFGTNGTTVVATLPITRAGAESELSSREEQVPAPADRDEEKPRRRILIADDHELMRRGLRGLIESQQEWAVCGEAVGGEEAVRKTQELNPDLGDPGHQHAGNGRIGGGQPVASRE